VEQGRKILQDSPIANVIMAPTMEGGAEEIVKRVKAAQ
jgi:succinyl-CoA synthetase beta subunit